MNDPATRPSSVASIRQRLQNLARAESEDFQAILIRYGLERFLFRLGRSDHADQYLLKGAFLFYAWSNEVARPTRDLDFLSFGPADVENLENSIASICRTRVPADGLVFDRDSIRGRAIRGSAVYDGVRVKLTARLGNIRIPIQVDVGFGDAVTPAATALVYPTLLDHPAPEIHAYQPPTVIAEKFEAMVSLGAFNSRFKDFYDIWQLSRRLPFTGPELVAAVRATFERRTTSFPESTPLALSEDFGRSKDRERMWKAFVTRLDLDVGGATFALVISDTRPFLLPVLDDARSAVVQLTNWLPGGPWKTTLG